MPQLLPELTTQTEVEFLDLLAVLPASDHAQLALGNTQGITLMHLCAIRSWPLVLSWLVNHQVPINPQDSSGTTPLHLATTRTTFHHLLRLGADPYLQDHQGRPAAQLLYLNGWGKFLPPPGFPASRKYYPFPQWSQETRLEQWSIELGHRPIDAEDTPFTETDFELHAFLDAHIRTQLATFVQALTHNAPPKWEIIPEPRLPHSQWTLRLTSPVSAGELIALYVGKIGHPNRDTPRNPAYTFMQGPYFVDATTQGSGAELINDSFPNMTTITLEEDGVFYTCLVATEDLSKGSFPYYFYGPQHPMTHHIELNETEKSAWLAQKKSCPVLPESPTSTQLYQRLDYLTKISYLNHRYPKESDSSKSTQV